MIFPDLQPIGTFPRQDQADVQEVGRVLSVGDGIARIYGLKGVKAGRTTGPKADPRSRSFDPVG